MQFFKKNSACFIAPLFVAIILSVVFFTADLFPFGPRSLSWGDMAQQNLPVLIEFKDILSGKQPLFFSMVNAGGMSFLGMFLFLASSPFSFLVAFVDKADIIYFINILIALKIMTSAVTASIFFKHFFKNLKPFQISALAVSYALCGYSMLFYQLDTWLDVMYMFPLLLIAFESLIKKDKLAPYVISLSLMITFQFYLGYMLALFIIFAFALYILLLAEKENRKKNVVVFGIGTFLAVLVSAPVWMSAISQYKNSARRVDLIESLAGGRFVTGLTTTIPFIIATGLILVMIPFIFHLKLISEKKLRPIIIMFLLLFIPIIIEPINKMWHTGSYQCFPVRYGYMTVLVGLTLCAAVISRLNSEAKKPPEGSGTAFPLFAAVAVLLAVAVWLIFTKGFYLNDYSTSLSGSKMFLLCITVYTVPAFLLLYILFRFYKSGVVGIKLFTVILCCIIGVEGFFNCSVYIGFGARDISKYTQFMDIEGKIQDQSLYRVKVRKKYYDVNLIGAMGYNSLAHYTSLISEDYIFAMKKLGYSSYWMEVNSNDSTVFTDALFGNKYTVIKYNNTFSSNVVYQNGVYSVIKNPYNMSLGNVITKEQADALAVIPPENRIAFQQKLYETLTGRKTPLITQYNSFDTYNVDVTKNGVDTDYTLPYKGATGYISYNIHVNGRQHLYFDCFKNITTNLTEPTNDSFNIQVNGLTVQTKYPSKSMNGMFDLGVYEDEDVPITISVLKSGEANSFGVFGIDLDELSQGFSKISPAEVKSEGDTITAQAQADSDGQMLMLTIPYNDGFNITVNGKEVKAQKTLDAFMSIPLEKGANTISLKFFPKGLKTGMLVFGAGIALLIAASLFLKKKKYVPIKWLENVLTFGFLGAAAIAFLAVYVFPVIVYLLFWII